MTISLRVPLLLITALLTFFLFSPPQSPGAAAAVTSGLKPRQRQRNLHCDRCSEQPPRTKNLYLDLGANRGNTIQLFLRDSDLNDKRGFNNKNEFVFPYNPGDFRIVGVEAMRSTHGTVLEALQQRYPTQIELIWAAVGTEDGGTLRIYRDEGAAGEGEWGAGILPLFSKNYVDVPTLDVSSWLSANACLCDFVVVKMNIEGSEFALIDKMLQQGTLCLFDVAHIYFHPKFFSANASQLVERINDVYKPAFEKCGISTEVWSVH